MTTITTKNKEAVRQIQAHPAFMSAQDFEGKFACADSLFTMSEFIARNGGLITQRHDCALNNIGKDFLVNLMIDTLVLHIDPNGTVSLHAWRKGHLCSDLNRLPAQKERYFLKKHPFLMFALNENN